MNRSTIGMLVVFAALLTMWALSGEKREAERELPSIVVTGFLKEEVSLQDIKIYNKDELSPYTRYTVEKIGSTGKETYLLELDPKTANEKKASDKIWWVTRTFEGGKRSMKVRAENYRLRMYNQLLARSFRSSYAFKTEGKDLSEYGLDDAHAIKVTAVSPKQTVNLIIGNRHEMEDGEFATWVMNPELKGVVYQISGYDLRTNLAAPWKDIRDRKILRINPGRIHKIEVQNPRSPGRGTVVAERAKLTAEQLVKIEKAEKWDEVRKADADWKITAPTGFSADGQEIGSWLESLERMSATDYVDRKDGKLPEKTGLDDPKKGVKVKLYDGDKVVELIIGGRNPKGQEKDVFVQVLGHSVELYTVAGWMGDQIVMDRDKLRDRRLLTGKKAADAIGLEINSGTARFVASRSGSTWTSASSIDPKNVQDFLGDLDSIRVEWQSQMTREEAGLKPPKTRISLLWKGAEGQPNERITLLVASKKKDKGYAAFKTGDVFQVPSWNAGRLHRRPRDFADKHIVPVPAEKIASITLPSKKSAKMVTLTRAGGTWKASNGAKIKGAMVDGLLKSLIESTFHEEVDDKPGTIGLAPPAYELSVKTTDGRTFGLQLSSKLLENNPYGAMLVNGKRTRIFSISAMMVPMLQRRVEDLDGSKPAAAPGRPGRPGAPGMPPMGGAQRPAPPPVGAPPAGALPPNAPPAPPAPPAPAP